jgi:hypothetical protein
VRGTVALNGTPTARRVAPDIDIDVDVETETDTDVESDFDDGANDAEHELRPPPPRSDVATMSRMPDRRRTQRW